MRRMTSPERPRRTPSGLTRTRVRWVMPQRLANAGRSLPGGSLLVALLGVVRRPGLGLLALDLAAEPVRRAPQQREEPADDEHHGDDEAETDTDALHDVTG